MPSPATTRFSPAVVLGTKLISLALALINDANNARTCSSAAFPVTPSRVRPPSTAPGAAAPPWLRPSRYAWTAPCAERLIGCTLALFKQTRVDAIGKSSRIEVGGARPMTLAPSVGAIADATTSRPAPVTQSRRVVMRYPCARVVRYNYKGVLARARNV